MYLEEFFRVFCDYAIEQIEERGGQDVTLPPFHHRLWHLWLWNLWGKTNMEGGQNEQRFIKMIGGFNWDRGYPIHLGIDQIQALPARFFFEESPHNGRIRIAPFARGISRNQEMRNTYGELLPVAFTQAERLSKEFFVYR